MAFIEEESYDPEINPKSAVAVDVVIFSILDNDLRVLLIQRDFWPFNGNWCLPGGFAGPKETLEETAKRELAEQTGIRNIYLEQCNVISDPGRDPRTRVISVSFMAVVAAKDYNLPDVGEKTRLEWYPFNNLPPLIFDHAQIIQGAYIQLRQRLKYSNIAWRLLPREFTLSQLQNTYEIISARELDKRNFRKKVLGFELVVSADRMESGVQHRPAQLYRFKK
ncbi:TPA: NUDIX hydrolase [candidate division CPR2 bacterium]|uniref:NUDIX hydrolase n=1 Tax=candidate division CPR2 bacterium GW2011_GWC1_41_48 TaxID=1618344 RepID=A0A0G0W8P8_UNCC2|nr:MAG: NUDIX hydrolase [candidate division CPR2 bacterium GW2011_GWC2_39_35]KKR28296.1 MAG: NUDIX hydrolase [candidate division CPR2 bacterium GW2011_GWD2_39_7]KKS09369.1 MAG: NUDIX hydrolase [candidate division CPR2 bacterium GW2011_GWC1_41_48]OGB72437.1 MAG: hypothetical protein A2Y26_01730 [candidate division CPR2 bacterium GWD2_39_7]HBG82124.1 NUDIX hydrolase [candidate division CPR2 bacterium]